MNKPKISAELAAQLSADPAKALCPHCQQRGFYDNRENKRNPKAPDYKCKNKGCDVGNGYPCGVYLRDFPEGAAPAKHGNGHARPSVTWPQMKKAYHECVAMAIHEAGEMKKAGITITGQEVGAMAATLMITRDKVNCWPPLAAPPAPPPPPPPPSPPPEEQDGYYSNEENLPF